jgi:hypothetical protein
VDPQNFLKTLAETGQQAGFEVRACFLNELSIRGAVTA